MEYLIKNKIKEALGETVTSVILKGKGAVCSAYYVETEEGGKYIIKQELDKKDFEPQNLLNVEAKVAQFLFDKDLSIETLEVVFISENPSMYGYKFIDGETLKNVWNDFSRQDKILVCEKLGKFHAEIGRKVSKEDSIGLGIKIDKSSDLHPETLKEYEQIISDIQVPKYFKDLAKKARDIFDDTNIDENLVFQFIHNDAHHENILIKDKQIVGFIDYGNTEYGEVTKEFSRYIRDFPDYFKYIVSSYEKESGNKLSFARLITNSFLSGLIDNVLKYKKGGESEIESEQALQKYKELIAQVEV